MNTLFINISREAIILQGNHIDEVLPYDDIERNFPRLFSQIVQGHEIESIWLLNGPGGFTMLRVGCVTINIWNAAHEKKLDLYTCSKLNLYSYAVEQGLLPEVGVVYIGQKKKVRKIERGEDGKMKSGNIEHGSKLRDIEKDRHILGNWSTDYLSDSTVGELIGKDYFVDQFAEHMLLEQLDKKRMVEMKFTDGSLILTYMGKELIMDKESLLFQSVERVEPEYMMEPTLN